MTDLRPHIKAHGTAELLPCPFCGGKAKTEYIRDGRQVRCQTRECWGSGPPQFNYVTSVPSAEERAVAAWNRRAVDFLPVEPPAAGEPVAWLVRSPNNELAVWAEPVMPPDMVAFYEQHGWRRTPLYTAPAGDELGAGLREAIELLTDMNDAFRPFTNRPMGAPGSQVRQDQARQIAISAMVGVFIAKNHGVS